MLKQINATTITLILRKKFPGIIDEAQCVFGEGRNIIQNVLLCQELTRGFNRKHSKAKCLMKVDLKKAYDSVSWEFIEEMMAALHLPWKLIYKMGHGLCDLYLFLFND